MKCYTAITKAQFQFEMDHLAESKRHNKYVKRGGFKYEREFYKNIATIEMNEDISVKLRIGTVEGLEIVFFIKRTSYRKKFAKKIEMIEMIVFWTLNKTFIGVLRWNNRLTQYMQNIM